MKIRSISITIVAGLFTLFVPFAGSNQAGDTTITINGHTAGVTPFISNLSLTASNTTVLKSIQFTIAPKPGSVTRPLSGTYANYYLVNRGFENPQTGEIMLPVYGICASSVKSIDRQHDLAGLRTVRRSKLTPQSRPQPTMISAATTMLPYCSPEPTAPI